MNSDRRYNVVLYGIKESPVDTSRAKRQEHDLKNILFIFTEIDKPLSSSSIRDFYRLGKFKESSKDPRPLLVKFLRAFEASIVLSSRRNDKSTREERDIHSIIMKERWNLIQNEIDRKHIKILGNSIYVNKKLHGTIQGSLFSQTATSCVNDNSLLRFPASSNAVPTPANPEIVSLDSKPMSVTSVPIPSTETRTS